MTEQHDLSERVRERLREAATWRLLGQLFECPSEQWFADIETLARELGDDALLAAAASARDTATEGQYHSVFGPGGPAPPREATYHETLELGSLMSELAVYYAAFAYNPKLQESFDHVSVEVGFIAFLKLKEAYALAAGDEEHAQVAASAADRFATDHLAMMAKPLATMLSGSHLEYLAEAARLVAERVGPPPKSGRLPMLTSPISDDDEVAEFECATP